MTVVRASQLVVQGLMVRARHPWLSGKLKQYAAKLGIYVPSDAIVLRVPPPWSKVRDYLSAASDYQLEAMLAFGNLAHETAGKPLIDRIRIIKSQLKGKTYGRTPKPPAANLPKVKAELERRRRGARVVAPVAAGGGAPIV